MNVEEDTEDETTIVALLETASEINTRRFERWHVTDDAYGGHLANIGTCIGCALLLAGKPHELQKA